MYCKKCGKSIADDSRFCRYCGTKVDGADTPLSDNINTKIHDDSTQVKTATVISTQKANPVEVVVSKKSTVRSTTIANEVTANTKMIFIAVLLWIVYIIGFTIYHQNDVKPMDDNSWYGESCYDGDMTCNGDLSWERHLAMIIESRSEIPTEKHIKHSSYGGLLSNLKPNFNPLDPGAFMKIAGMSPGTALSYAQQKAKKQGMSKEDFEQYKQEAIRQANEDKRMYWESITLDRKHFF